MMRMTHTYAFPQRNNSNNTNHASIRSPFSTKEYESAMNERCSPSFLNSSFAQQQHDPFYDQCHVHSDDDATSISSLLSTRRCDDDDGMMMMEETTAITDSSFLWVPPVSPQTEMSFTGLSNGDWSGDDDDDYAVSALQQQSFWVPTDDEDDDDRFERIHSSSQETFVGRNQSHDWSDGDDEYVVSSIISPSFWEEDSNGDDEVESIPPKQSKVATNDSHDWSDDGVCPISPSFWEQEEAQNDDDTDEEDEEHPMETCTTTIPILSSMDDGDNRTDTSHRRVRFHNTVRVRKHAVTWGDFRLGLPTVFCNTAVCAVGLPVVLDTRITQDYQEPLLHEESSSTPLKSQTIAQQMARLVASGYDKQEIEQRFHHFWFGEGRKRHPPIVDEVDEQAQAFSGPLHTNTSVEKRFLGGISFRLAEALWFEQCPLQATAEWYRECQFIAGVANAQEKAHVRGCQQQQQHDPYDAKRELLLLPTVATPASIEKPNKRIRL